MNRLPIVARAGIRRGVPGGSRSAGRMRSRTAGARLLALVILANAVAGSPARGDDLDDLRKAVLAFRGVGYAEVSAYRAELRLPDEEEAAVPLRELWRAPAEFGLRAAGKAPGAVVRSWAIFLDPLYVARTSLLDAELDAGADRLREIARIDAEAAAEGGRLIRVTLPDRPDSLLPGFLRDVGRLEGRVDGRGRLRGFHIEFRATGTRAPETIELACTWEDAKAPQPSLCTWSLPDGGEVRVATTFRDEGARRVPAARHVVFPSRYDSGETEEIRIEYGEYDFRPPPDLFDGPGVFRYDANGLVPD